MNTPSDAMSHSPLHSQVIASNRSPSRPIYWSVWREVWEYRSLYLVPMIAGGLILVGYLLGAIKGSQPLAEDAVLTQPFSLAASVIMGTSFIVAITYCIGALNNERRDRSILFWKSLPVSDLTTVLSKASIPLLVQPPITFAAVIVTQLIMFLIGSGVLLLSGADVTALWHRLPVFQMPMVLLYGLMVTALWYAPFYAWLLLVSCWARRAPLLWSLSPLTICIIEKIAFGSAHFGQCC
jgi:ABC-2 type transport system permease protein